MSADLYLSPCQEAVPGKAEQQSYVLFHRDEIQQTHKELTARGVEFTAAPAEQMWGWSATFKDPDGSLYVLNQRGD